MKTLLILFSLLFFQINKASGRYAPTHSARYDNGGFEIAARGDDDDRNDDNDSGNESDDDRDNDSGDDDRENDDGDDDRDSDSGNESDDDRDRDSGNTYDKPQDLKSSDIDRDHAVETSQGDIPQQAPAAPPVAPAAPPVAPAAPPVAPAAAPELPEAPPEGMEESGSDYARVLFANTGTAYKEAELALLTADFLQKHHGKNLTHPEIRKEIDELKKYERDLNEFEEATKSLTSFVHKPIGDGQKAAAEAADEETDEDD